MQLQRSQHATVEVDGKLCHIANQQRRRVGAPRAQGRNLLNGQIDQLCAVGDVGLPC